MPESHILVALSFYPSFFFTKSDLCFKLGILVSEDGALHNRHIWPEAPRAAKFSVLSPQITLMWNNLGLLPSVLPSLLPVLYSSSPIVYFILN